MTDNEIIKTAELCCEHNPQCAMCPLNDYDTCDECMGKLLKRCLELIKQKDKEIEILIRKKHTLTDEVAELRAELERIKAESVREFAKFIIDKESNGIIYAMDIVDYVQEFLNKGDANNG